jgi:hypothetical protein
MRSKIMERVVDDLVFLAWVLNGLTLLYLVVDVDGRKLVCLASPDDEI